MSFRFKILVVVMVSLFAVTFISGILFINSQSGQKAQIQQSFETNAKALSQSIASQFFERYGDVQVFALNPVLNSGDKSAITEVFNGYAKLYGIYNLILFISSDGKLIASNNLSANGEPLDLKWLSNHDFKNEIWFQESLKGRFTNDSKNSLEGTFVESPVVDKIVSNVYKKDIFGNGFSSVVKNSSGEVIGVLSNRANFSWVENEYKELAHKLKEQGFGKTDMLLLNKAGDLIIEYRPNIRDGDYSYIHNFERLTKINLLKNEDQTGNFLKKGSAGVISAPHYIDGVEQVIAYTPIISDKFVREVGWGIVFSTSEDELFHGLIRAKKFYFISIIITFLISVGLLWFVLNSITANMEKIVSEIKDATASVFAAGVELSHASDDVATSTSSAAASLEETAASMEELHSMVQQSLRASSEAESQSKMGLVSASSGSENVKILVQAMESLMASSKKINEITHVIDDIAFQTNLLALNAAVEAARAGESGRGFSVVADAVRGLSQQSAESAKQIGMLIDENAKFIEQGHQLALKSEQSFVESAQFSKTIVDVNVEIRDAAESSSAGIGQINKAVQSLDEVTQKNAGTAEELTASAKQLTEQTKNMTLSVEKLDLLLHGSKKIKTAA